MLLVDEVDEVDEVGARVEVRVVGYEFSEVEAVSEDAGGGWDANWLVIAGSARTAQGAAWSFAHPSLTTWEVADLISWLREAAVGQVPVATAMDATPTDPADEDEPYWGDRLEGAGWLVFTEPNLSFAVGGVEGSWVQLLVGLGAESGRPPARPGQPGWHQLALAMTTTQLQEVAAALQAELDRYPAR